MALTAGDQAMVREIAYEVARVIAGEMQTAMIQAIRIHGLECPTAKDVGRYRDQLRGLIIGIAMGSGLAGAGIVIGIQKLFQLV